MKLKDSPLAWVSFAMIVGVMGTALISPLYGLYREAWNLRPSDVSLVYAIYMGGALCGLLFFGRLSDSAGFRTVMQWGLGLVFVGTAITLAAWNLASLSIGRFLVGIASTMVATSSMVGFSALTEPARMQRVSVISGFLMAFGFGLGPLVGGIIAQWAPYPLRTTFVPTLVLVVLGLVALRRLQLPASALPEAGRGLRWRDAMPRLTWPERASSGAFVLTSSLPFLAFGVFGLYASMSPLFLDKLVPWHGPAVAGTAIAAILMLSACVQASADRIPTRWCGAGGLLCLAVSNALLMVNLVAGSGTLFAIGVLFTAVGHALSMLAGMRMVHRIATPGNRSGLLSTYLLIGYIGSMAPMMAMGWIADHFGLPAAVTAFCAVVIVAASVVAWLFQRHPRMQPQP